MKKHNGDFACFIKLLFMFLFFELIVLLPSAILCDFINKEYSIIIIGFFEFFAILLVNIVFVKIKITKQMLIEKIVNFFDIKLLYILLLSIILYFLLLTINHYFLIFYPIPEDLKKTVFFVSNNSFGNQILVLIVVLIISSFEEIFFRGILLNKIYSNNSRIKIISILVFSSFLYGFFHLNPWQFLNAFLFGIISGIIFIITRNLFYCISLHFFLNVHPLLFNYLFTKLNIKIINQWYFDVPIIGFLCILIYLFLKIFCKKTPKQDNSFTKFF